MASENINVSLNFTAQTGQAKASIQELQTLLNKIAAEGASISGKGVSKEAKEIKAASNAAIELQNHLNNAFNVKTGNFDLSLLDKSLKSSGSNVSNLTKELLRAGEDGQQAFVKLAQSISLADQPMFKINSKLQDFASSLKKTMSWQLSNNVIRGFMGAIQTAYGYAQDLNASLTDIRIVTGKSSDEMARFAEQANKAAKALSTTTTDYTKGSLIYFQQGLNDQEVAERTETTIKMANVTGESTSKIADQMTAVWNNFADGSKELSYYADVMTALGAATASSSDEISEGINKFAATAKTVGLSYEYATAALATVTARTRESADVVGNAFKTLFARIQGLNQGNTLDDGTTLNKYSSALMKVGVNIKTASGELKGMDTILDELGPKWKTLADAEKMALAQAVSGVRQYSQFMALMNNYDYFKENVSVAEESTGTLQEQANIYEESWKAASKRVRASAESLYQDLIDDKFFISINNGIANVLSGLDAFIDKAGGLKTVITAVSGVFLSAFASKIPDAIKTTKYNFEVLFGGSQKAYQNIINEVNTTSQEQFKKYQTSKGKQGIDENSSMGVSLKLTNQLTAATTMYHQAADSLSSSEKQRLQIELAILENKKEQIAAQAKENEETRKGLELKEKQLKEKDISKIVNKPIQGGLESLDEAGQILFEKSQQQKRHSQKNRNKAYYDATEANTVFYDQLNQSREEFGKLYNERRQGMLQQFSQGGFDTTSFIGARLFRDEDFDTQQSKTGLGVMLDSMKKTAQSSIDSADKLAVFQKQLKALKSTIPDTVAQATGLNKEFNKIANIKDPTKLVDGIDELTEKLKNAVIPATKFEEVLKSWDKKDIEEIIKGYKGLTEKEATNESDSNNFGEQIKGLSFDHIFTGVDAFAALGGSLMSSAAGIQMVSSAIQSLNDPNLNSWEKLTASLSGFIGGISMLKGGLQQIIPLYKNYVTAGIEEAAVSSLGTRQKNFLVKKLGEETVGRLASKAAIMAQKGATEDEIVAAITEELITKKGVTAKQAENRARILAKINIDKENLSLIQHIALLAQLHPIMTALVAVATVAIGILANKVINSYKNANKEIEEANQQFEDSKSAVEELTSKLKDLDKQIDELNNKDQLTLVDKQDLKNLQSQKALLEAQLKIQQQLFDLKQKNQANTISGNWSKSTKPYKLPVVSEGYWDTFTNSDGEEEKILQNKSVSFEQYLKDTGYDIATDSIVGENKTADSIETIRENIKNAQEKLVEYMSDYSDEFEKQEENYRYILEAEQNGNYTWKTGEKEKFQADLQRSRKYMYSLDPQGYNDTYLKPIFEQIDPSSLLENFSNFDTSISDALGVSEEEFKTFFDNGVEAARGKLEDFNLDISKLTGKQLYTLIQNLDLIEGKDFKNIEELQDYLNDVAIKSDVVSQVHSLREDIETLVGLVGDLNVGDILSEADYNLLVEYNKELEKYFMYAGTKNGKRQYKYVGGADDEIDKLGVEEQVQQMRNDYAIYQASQKYKYKNGEQYDWMSTNADTINPETLKNLANDTNIDWSTFADGKTYTKESIEEIAKGLAGESEEITKEEAKKQATLFLDTFKETISVGSMSGIDEQEEFQYLSKDTLNELDSLHDKIGNAEAYGKALRLMARGYDENSDAVIKYEEALKKLEDSTGQTANDIEKLCKKLATGEIKYENLTDAQKDVIKAQRELKKEINKAEWDKFTEKALKYAQALKSTKDVDKQLRGIQKAFKDTKGMDVSMEILKNYKDLFIEWGEAGEEESDDIMTKIYSLISLEKAQEGQLIKMNENGTISIGTDTQQFETGLGSLEDWYATVKSAIENNKITVSANGEADFTQMIQDIIAAGGTAADLAAALAAAGATTVDFSGWGSGGGTFDLTTLEGLFELTQWLEGWSGGIMSTGNNTGPLLDAIQKAFPNGKIPKTTGIGGGRHSGGNNSSGSGSSKSKSHADTKSYADKDRYHTVKNQLEDLNAQYDALDKAKDRAFGKDKLKEMDAEIAKTDELINKQGEYLQEIEDYLPKDRAIMEKAYNEYIGGPAIEYDKDGNISNFDAIQDAMFEKYNQMAKDNTDDSEAWKEFEKKYKLLEDYIKQYEETYDLLRDERDKMQELINQKIDLGLEKVQYQVEIALDVPDDTLKVLEYKLGKLDDNAADAIESIGLLVQKMNEINKKVKVNQAGLADLLKLSMSEAEITEILNGNFEALEKYDENGIKNINFTEDQIEAIKEYRDNLIDLNSELDDIRESIEEKVMTAFDDWNDKLSKGVSLIDHYSSTLESYRNIIDIVGRDTLGATDDFMGKLAQSTVDVAIDKLRTTVSSYEALASAQKNAQDKLQEAQARNDKESVDFWKETLDSITEEVNSANEQMMQAWEDALSSIADNFENTINDLVDSFNKSVYPLGGLDGLSDEFSRQKENADSVLDDYQKIYELSKLARDVNKTIDDTDIISGKQKLKKLLEQINDLQADGNEMSQYDLEYLQKTYDLRLAEIELEEAQRAKNTVRLQKDNEGNWSYIYTQSSDAIDSAQQKYEDALYAMQDLSSNYIDEMSEKLISTSKDMEEALANIRIQDFASQEDYYKEVKRVQDIYAEQLKRQEDELNKAIKNNKELYDKDWMNYHDATGYKISDADKFAKSFKDTLLGNILGSDSEESTFGDMMNGLVDNLTLGIKQAAETYFANIEEAMKAAGTSTKDFVSDASTAVTKVLEDSKKGVESANEMADGMKTAFDKITDYVSNWQKTYGEQIKTIQNMNLSIVESFNEMLKALSVDPDLITVSYDFNRIKKSEEDDTSSYDTGGYTGEWGSSGKLAYLHQKELVLNADDTKNMLAAVQFTRSILDTIDINARAASLGLGSLSAATLKDDKQQTLQQDVHITAEFPNVNDHNEIEEAFNNLINQASQYVNRK